jgi:uncharacterized protein (TIGR02996 family)
MTLSQPFLQAILDHPQADRPRSDYARWLDERCDPLGEFIRVQCRLASAGNDGPCLFELETREQELLHEFGERWAGPVASAVSLYVFRRGFVEEVAVTAAEFLAHADALFGLAPIQVIHFSDAGDQVAALAHSAHLGRAQFLDFSDNRLGDSGVRVLIRSRHLGEVRGLNLTAVGMGDAGAQALAGALGFHGLRELYLDGNRIGNAGAQALAASPQLRSLTGLFLANNVFGSEGRRILSQSFGVRVHF